MNLKRRAIEFYLRGFHGRYMNDKDTIFTVGAMIAIWFIVVHLLVWVIQGIGVFYYV